ncbi:hypothetical protein BU17DRAFT_71793 [Hysterangium stoloniferum]|nr:hypothetical protein BU17DRAFT_71793 [Hysterangium stoloniferum]
MFAWGAVLVWGEIEGTNTTARVTQPATRVTQHGQTFLRVAFDKVREKETRKEIPEMPQDNRLPQLSMDVENQKLTRSSLPPKGIISLINRILHPVLKRQSNHSQRDSRRCWRPTKYAVTTDAVCCNASTYKLARKQNRVSDFLMRFGFGFGFGFGEVGRVGGRFQDGAYSQCDEL